MEPITVEPQRIYLAGPMSGIKDYNFPEFVRVARILAEAGYDVVTPCDLHLNGDGAAVPPTTDEVKPLGFYLKQDFELILSCDAIIALPTWQNSKGAKAELAVGQAIGLECYEYIDARYAEENQWIQEDELEVMFMLRPLSNPVSITANDSLYPKVVPWEYLEPKNKPQPSVYLDRTVSMQDA